MKKGFTLIELLAVILILGIIALIAVPQVTNTIEKSKKGAVETSCKHYIDAVTNAIGLNQLDEDESNDINDGTHSVSQLTVDISGEAPQSGTVVIEEGSVKNANFTINGYSVTYAGKGKCTASKGKTLDVESLATNYLLAIEYLCSIESKNTDNVYYFNEIFRDEEDEYKDKVDLNNLPTSGYVILDDNGLKVVSAKMIINGKEVSCVETTCSEYTPGKVNVDYVYYQDTDYVSTVVAAEDGLTTRPTTYNSYLKYPVQDKTYVGVPQACFYDNGTEFCLNNNEYETSKQRILNYFEYDETTWAQDSLHEEKWTHPTNSAIYCDINDSDVCCYGPAVFARAHSRGDVNVRDASARYYCYVRGNGSAAC